MQALDQVRALYEYNEWANNRVLQALSGISDDELLRQRDMSHNSIGVDLAHLLLAQVGWLSIWQGGARPVSLPGAGTGRHLDNLVDGLQRSDAAIREFIDTLSDSDLGQQRIDNPEGQNPSVTENRSMLLWDMMVHVVNHGTQHRAEAGMALTQFGRSPGDVDFVDFLGA